MNVNGNIDRKMQTNGAAAGAFGNAVSGQGPLENAKGNRAALARYIRLYYEERPNILNVLAIEQLLANVSGIEGMASRAFVMVPLDNLNPWAVELACGIGKAPKEPLFSNTKVILFLQGEEARAIVGIVSSPESIGEFDYIKLCAFAAPISPARGRIFVNIAHSHGIKLKMHEMIGSGWTAFSPG
jgi:hypothetical protein